MAWPMLIKAEDHVMKTVQFRADETIDKQMPKLLRTLFVEDSDVDAELVKRHLLQSGYDIQSERVYDSAAFTEALRHGEWDVVLCDYWLPSFTVMDALDILKDHNLDLPFIVVSGVIGETLAVDVMKAGAHDYITKENLTRLVPAIEREWREAQARRERRAAIDIVAHLAA